MKNRDNSRLFGTLFLITGIFGVILALGILLATWIIAPKLVNNTKDMLTSASSLLGTTNEGLSVIKSSLEMTSSSLVVMDSSLESLSTSFVDLSSLSSKTGDLVGGNLTEILDETQTSLESSSKGAKFVDDTLNILANIPLLGLDYRPDIPLHSSLNNLAVDVSLLRNEIATIEAYIDAVSSDLSDLELSTQEIKVQISEFSIQINNATEVIDSYIAVIDQISAKVSNIIDNVSAWVYGLATLLTLAMLWLLLIQLMPLMQAYELIVGKQHYVNIHDIRNVTEEKTNTISEEKNA